MLHILGIIVYYLLCLCKPLQTIWLKGFFKSNSMNIFGATDGPHGWLDKVDGDVPSIFNEVNYGEQFKN